MAFPVLTTGFTWTEPTQNVDGTPITAGEITGYQLGVRADGTGSAGTYAQTVSVTGSTASSLTASALKAALSLSPGDYWAAVRDVGPVDSAWTNELPFSIPPPTPNPPSNFAAA